MEREVLQSSWMTSQDRRLDSLSHHEPPRQVSMYSSSMASRFIIALLVTGVMFPAVASAASLVRQAGEVETPQSGVTVESVTPEEANVSTIPVLPGANQQAYRREVMTLALMGGMGVVCTGLACFAVWMLHRNSHTLPPRSP